MDGVPLDDLDDYHDMVSMTSTLSSSPTLSPQSNSFVSKLLLKFTWNWTTSTFAFVMMRPETFAFLSAFIVIFCLCHNFDLWSGILVNHRRQGKWWSLFFRLPSTESSTVSASSLFSTGLDDKYEMKNDKVGIFAIRGRRGKMEDAFDYVNETQGLGVELYGVFDGHGSEKASQFTQRHLFKAIVNRIALVVNGTVASGGDLQKDTCPTGSTQVAEKENDQTCINSKMSDTCMKPSSSDFKSSNEESFTTFLESSRRLNKEIKNIIREEVLKLDDRLLQQGRRDMEFGGTTAVFAVRLHSLNRLIVANIGDSRGVLCNSRGIVVPLSVDHKPQSPSEHKRIKASGGFIKFNGVWRVGGILATSRALGDALLKDRRFITAEPDILSFDLSEHQPQFIILASDGLWDTLSNEEAVKMARDHLANLRKRGRTENLAFDMAKMLTLESYKRLSLDNITVIVVLFDPKDFHSASTSFGIYSSQRNKNGLASNGL